MSKAKSKSLIPLERIERSILLIRRQKVMLDSDLAALYGVSTKVLNQAVKRNKDRFPPDFMFRLTKREKEEVVTICDHLQKLKFSPVQPYAFTEHGAIMVASVLNSKRAIDTSMFVVRAFVRLRAMLAEHKDLARRLDELEKKYDKQFKVVFDAIRQLMTPPEPNRRKIGYHVKEGKGSYRAPGKKRGGRRSGCRSGRRSGRRSGSIDGQN